VARRPFGSVRRGSAQRASVAVPALACEPRTRTDKEVASTVPCEYINVDSFRTYIDTYLH